MPFELSIAKKYLIPGRKSFSASLIALMSVVVIALVVWLVLIFLSVTEGIEKNWLKNATDLNAPIQITPTKTYYDSYYYQVDAHSEASGFTHKTIGEKRKAERTDPYDPDIDPPLPSFCAKHLRTIDPVKAVFEAIRQAPGSPEADDYEVDGALFKVFAEGPIGQDGTYGQVTQASYIGSLSENDPAFFRLIEPPRIEDINRLLRDNPTSLLSHLTIRKVRSKSVDIPYLLSSLPEKGPVRISAHIQDGEVRSLFFPPDLSRAGATEKKENREGLLTKREGKLCFTADKTYILSPNLPLRTDFPLSMEVIGSVIVVSGKPLIPIRATIRGLTFSATIPLEETEIEQAVPTTLFSSPPSTLPPWVCQVGERIVLPRFPDKRTSAVIAPKALQAHGIKIGDQGYLSYDKALAGSIRELQLPVTIAGFYDPGIMAVGARTIFADKQTVRMIASDSSPLRFDQSMGNGIRVFCPEIHRVDTVLDSLTKALEKAGISAYWNITPYYDYPFIKPLLQQFQSDKYLFTLIGAIILIVAFSNIVSLLALLVNDKKKEIAILSAMGTPKRRIGMIFLCCSIIMGGLGTLIGTLAAFLTLHHIDQVVRFLSFLQGHDAFHTAFYGKSLPNSLSRSALTFTVIATPLISLFSGLVPALRACRLHPSLILREE